MRRRQDVIAVFSPSVDTLIQLPGGTADTVPLSVQPHTSSGWPSALPQALQDHRHMLHIDVVMDHNLIQVGSSI